MKRNKISIYFFKDDHSSLNFHHAQLFLSMYIRFSIRQNSENADKNREESF